MNNKDTIEIFGTESNEIINYLSTELILENLRDQIWNIKKSNNQDFIEMFNYKFNFVLSSYEDEDIRNEIFEIKNEFFNSVLKEIKEKFELEIEFSNNLTQEELNNLIYHLYIFFILRINDITCNFYTEEILDDKKNLIKSFKNEINQKDVFFTLLKKNLNKDHAVILYCKDEIVDSIDIETFEDFIEFVIKNDEYEETNYMIKSLFLDQVFSSDVSCDLDNLLKILKIQYHENSIVREKIRSKLYRNFLEQEEVNKVV